MLFFTKKYFIADMLKGLIDMHCHILPNIDDGAKGNAMALEMLKQYTELGYTGLIATPHIMDGFYDNTATQIIETSNKFQLSARENGYEDFSISTAAEYMMDGGFDKLLVRKEFLPIVGTQVLVEMSFLQPSLKVYEHIFQLQQKGFEPILAHPERYTYLSNISKILDLKKKGCYLQMNLLSLGDHYGSHVKKWPFPY